MLREIRTAVAVAATPLSRMQLVRGLSEANVHLDCMCADGISALHALADFRSDLLATDVQLPAMDGLTLAERALCSFALPVRPAVLILYDGCALPSKENALQRCGAIFLDRHADHAGFASAIVRLRNERIRFTSSEQQAADHLLDALGVPMHPGRKCLKYAALLCAADQRFMRRMRAHLHSEIGDICGMTARQAERAIRHVIDLAWQSDKFDNQYRIFADTVDAGRGQPTCGEMILRLADILRLEG